MINKTLAKWWAKEYNENMLLGEKNIVNGNMTCLVAHISYILVDSNLSRLQAATPMPTLA